MGTAVLPANMALNLEQEGITETTIPEITIKQWNRKHKMKWKMLRRETEDGGCTNRKEFRAQ
jgi:hypothetical protein